MSRASDVGPKAIYAHLSAHYGISTPSILSTGDLGGYLDQVVKVRTRTASYVLKISRKISAWRVREQLRFSVFLREKGFAVPRVYTSLDGDPMSFLHVDQRRYPCVLTEFVRGEPVQLGSIDPPELGRWVAMLHSASLKSFRSRARIFSLAVGGGPDRVPTIRERPWLRPLLSERRAIVANFLRRAPRLRSAMVVNDLTPDNVLVRGRARVIFDFNLAGVTPVIGELASASYHWLVEAGQLQSIPDFLRAYERRLPLTNSERALLGELIVFNAGLRFGLDKLRTPRDVETRQRRVEEVRGVVSRFAPRR